eukprot:3005490-Amphidinium_carterae.1
MVSECRGITHSKTGLPAYSSLRHNFFAASATLPVGNVFSIVLMTWPYILIPARVEVLAKQRDPPNEVIFPGQSCHCTKKVVEKGAKTSNKRLKRPTLLAVMLALQGTKK